MPGEDSKPKLTAEEWRPIRELRARLYPHMRPLTEKEAFLQAVAVRDFTAQDILVGLEAWHDGKVVPEYKFHRYPPDSSGLKKAAEWARKQRLERESMEPKRVKPGENASPERARVWMSVASDYALGRIRPRSKDIDIDVWLNAYVDERLRRLEAKRK